MKHKNEFVGTDEQGHKKSKRKVEHCHGNRKAVVKKAAKK